MIISQDFTNNVITRKQQQYPDNRPQGRQQRTNMIFLIGFAITWLLTVIAIASPVAQNRDRKVVLANGTYSAGNCTFGPAGSEDNMVWPLGLTLGSNQNEALPTDLGNCTEANSTCAVWPVRCFGLWTCCAPGIGWFAPGVEPSPISEKIEAAASHGGYPVALNVDRRQADSTTGAPSMTVFARNATTSTTQSCCPYGDHLAPCK